MGINVNSNKATHCGVVTVHSAEKAASGNCFVREHQVFHLLEIIIHLNLLSWVYVQVSVVNFLSISLIFFHWVFRKISLYLVEENREAPLVALPPHYRGCCSWELDQQNWIMCHLYGVLDQSGCAWCSPGHKNLACACLCWARVGGSSL